MVKEIDLELLQLQASLKGEEMLQGKSLEYREGFIAGCRYLNDYAEALYEVCDKMARRASPERIKETENGETGSK